MNETISLGWSNHKKSIRSSLNMMKNISSIHVVCLILSFVWTILSLKCII